MSCRGSRIHKPPLSNFCQGIQNRLLEVQRMTEVLSLTLFCVIKTGSIGADQELPYKVSRCLRDFEWVARAVILLDSITHSGEPEQYTQYIYLCLPLLYSVCLCGIPGGHWIALWCNCEFLLQLGVFSDQLVHLASN